MNRYGYVYKITNKINNKVYIGITHSPKNRCEQHFSYLRKGYHHSKKFQHSYDKHGEQVFEFQVIAKCTANTLFKLEIEYIKEYDSYRNGYNCTKGGEGGDWRPIKQFDLKGNFIEEYPSMTAASMEHSINHTHLWKVCNRKQPTAGGFQWCYLGKEDQIKKVCKERSKIKKVYQYSIDGFLLQEFEDGIKAAEHLAIKSNKSSKSVAINIRKVCQLQSEIAYGFQWRFEKSESIKAIDLKEKKKRQTKGILNMELRKERGGSIEQLSIEGEIVKIYSCIGKIKEEWKAKSHAIEQCLQGLQKSSQGFLWRYVDEAKRKDYKPRSYRFKNGKKIIIKEHKNKGDST